MAVVPAASPLLALPSATADLARIDVALRESVRTADPLLDEMAAHLISAGGKRLRPMLAIAAALTGRDHGSDDVVRGGVAVELVQVGSLYHDDVMDDAETRRGVPSANARWGNHRAILAGDFLLARASEIAASLGAEVAGLLGHTIGRLVEGQISELTAQYSPDRTIEQYYTSISGKTASLFAAATRIGGIVADLPRDHVEALTRFGDAYGMVFQIVDDILDITSTEAELGKPAGHDMREGIFSLPVLLTLEAKGPSSLELRDLLSGGEGSVGAPEAAKAITIVRAGEGIAGALTHAYRYAAEAETAIAPYVDSVSGDAMSRAAGVLIASVR